MEHAATIDETIKTRFNYTVTRTPAKVLAQLLYDRGVRPYPTLMEAMRGEYQEPAFHLQKLEDMIHGKIQPWAKQGFHKQCLAAIAAARQDPNLVEFLKTSTYHNIVPKVLRVSLASLFAGNAVSPTFGAKYLVLGSDSTAVTENDTVLGTETLRGLFTDRSSSDIVTTLDKFFDSTEVGGLTFLEAGIVVDGSITPDTGYLFSHVNINEAMGSGETLTINCTITVA